MAEPATKIPVKTEAKSAASLGTPAPWAAFDSLRREIDRLFESASTNPWALPLSRSAFALDLPWGRPGAWAINPAVDISEKENEFELSAELPGLTEKDVEVKLSNGSLVIKGEKSEEREEKDKNYHLSERRYGSFRRSFAVPEGVDSGKISAKFANGVLKVTLPKSAEAQAKEKKIEVKSA